MAEVGFYGRLWDIYQKSIKSAKITVALIA
jgi:hypothetical protein